jgi:hypothetical protein
MKEHTPWPDLAQAVAVHGTGRQHSPQLQLHLCKALRRAKKETIMLTRCKPAMQYRPTSKLQTTACTAPLVNNYTQHACRNGRGASTHNPIRRLGFGHRDDPHNPSLAASQTCSKLQCSLPHTYSRMRHAQHLAAFAAHS